MYTLYLKTTSCVAAIGSLSLAVKAQNALLSESVRAAVRSLSPGETRGGCAFGVAFPCEEEGKARAILRREKIQVRQLLRKEGPPL